MSQPYVGEIRIFAGNFAPVGWMFCDGATLAIADNDTLFNLIGTTYGGDGQSTFCLPNLTGRLPIHQGSLNGGGTYVLGEMSGSEQVTLSSAQIPSHNHSLVVVDAASGQGLAAPGGHGLSGGEANLFAAAVPSAAMAGQSIGNSGGSQPHTNFMPYLCVNFIISLYGVYPSQN